MFRAGESRESQVIGAGADSRARCRSSRLKWHIALERLREVCVQEKLRLLHICSIFGQIFIK